MHQGACTVRQVDLATSIRAFQKLPVGVTVWQLRDRSDVRSLHFVGVNPAAERELRAPLSSAVGKSIAECFPRLLDTPVPKSCRRVVLSGKPDTLGELAYQDGRIPGGVFWIDCFPLPDSCVGVALENITERKREVESQGRALRLLHRATLFLNNAPTLIEAAQFCVDEICTQIGLPVGRFFLADEMCPSRFVPNPVWHFSDARRFRAFRRATELYERDLTNKLALQHRTAEGHKAGIFRSVGFSVVENDCLRGVLELSSELPTPLDEHIFLAISNIGLQLGQVFARERLSREYSRIQNQMLSHSPRTEAVSSALRAAEVSLLTAVRSLESLHGASAIPIGFSGKLCDSIRLVGQGIAELRRLTVRPIEFPSRITH